MYADSIDKLTKQLSTIENILIIQDLDGVCIPLVKDPLKRKIDKDYVIAANKLKANFKVLTNGEHEGRRGVNRLIDNLFYKNKGAPLDTSLYLPGLAAGGVEYQDNYGNTEHPGVSKEEIDFLSKLPITIENQLLKELNRLMPEVSKRKRVEFSKSAVLDTNYSPTVNLNGIFEYLDGKVERQKEIQLMLNNLMIGLLDLAASHGLKDSFYLHIAPNLGSENGKEIIKYASKGDIGTTDIQFLISGAVKEAGLLVLLNKHIKSKIGSYPFGKDFNVRDAPKTIKGLLELTIQKVSKSDMPTLVGVGDTVTSVWCNKKNMYQRGGSDRGFLTLIQEIGNYYKTDNKIILVDSSGGEVERPKIDNKLPIGITDPEDPLVFSAMVPSGPKGYISWFITLSETRSGINV